jgi:hypothetical protein
MKYIDFSVQSLFFITVLVILTVPVGGSDRLLLVLWMQLLVGPWQLLSSVISVGRGLRLYHLKVIHLVVSAIYLTMLLIIPYNELPASGVKTILMVPAWSLAIYYYALTTKATFREPSRQSSFLPHTSF